jgi:hypothetical protein
VKVPLVHTGKEVGLASMPVSMQWQMDISLLLSVKHSQFSIHPDCSLDNYTEQAIKGYQGFLHLLIDYLNVLKTKN